MHWYDHRIGIICFEKPVSSCTRLGLKPFPGQIFHRMHRIYKSGNCNNSDSATLSVGSAGTCRDRSCPGKGPSLFAIPFPHSGL